MSDRSFDVNAIFETYRDALTPLMRVQQESIKTVERLARYQFSVAGDYLDWSIGHAKAVASTKSTADLVGQQSELNTRLGEQLRSRAQEFGQIATETSGAVTQWFDEASAKVAESVKKAA